MTFRSKMQRLAIVTAFAAAASSAAGAESPWARKITGADNLLPASQAFQLLSAERSGDEVIVSWAIAPGYYLYRKRLAFEATVPSGLPLDMPRLPKGEAVADEREGTTEVYRETLRVRLHGRTGSPSVQELRVRYQGCADAGVCYPPVTTLIGVTAAHH